MKIGHVIYKVSGAMITFFGDWYYSFKGQRNNYAILQTAHRIEKGLTIENPRKLWGWNKVDNLVDMIAKEMACNKPDYFAINTGLSVLKAYIDSKTRSEDKEEIKRVNSILQKNKTIENAINNCTTVGGAIKKEKSQVVCGSAEQLDIIFSTRHSIRDFQNKEIDKKTLIKAVQMALHSPSACNRQPTKVYVISGEKKKKLGYDNIYNADKYLIITADMSAFTGAEHGDWVVSSSIFSTYLVLALHSMGIGSCIMKKDLLFGNKYNTAIRKVCHIPNNEKIILEIAIGYYKDDIIVAYSNRKKAKDIVTFI